VFYLQSYYILTAFVLHFYLLCLHTISTIYKHSDTSLCKQIDSVDHFLNTWQYLLFCSS